MRVLYVFNRMGIGGAETMIMNILRQRMTNDFSFDFVVHTIQKGEYDDEIRAMGGQIFVCPQFSLKNTFIYKQWWNSFLQRNKYDIVHGNYRKSAAIYLREAKKYGIATIFHTHSASSRSSFASLRKIPALLLYKCSDQIFACSQKAAVWLFGDDILHDKKLKIVNNGIDMQQYSFKQEVREQYRNNLGLHNKLVVCHVGRFAPMKNHIFLIDVFAEIKKIAYNSCLLLAGDGELRKMVEKYVQEKELEDILFLGIRRDIPQLLQAADVFVLPSLFEGLPVSLVEAQAASLPCVFADTVTKEAVISNNAIALSLEQGLDVWAQEIVNVANIEPRLARDYSTNKFDVRVSAQEVIRTYRFLTGEI